MGLLKQDNWRHNLLVGSSWLYTDMTKLFTVVLLTLLVSYGSGKHFLVETVGDGQSSSEESSDSIILSNDNLGGVSQALVFSSKDHAVGEGYVDDGDYAAGEDYAAGDDYAADDDEVLGNKPAITPKQQSDYCNDEIDVGCLVLNHAVGEDYAADDDEVLGSKPALEPKRRTDYCNGEFDVGCDPRQCTDDCDKF